MSGGTTPVPSAEMRVSQPSVLEAPKVGRSGDSLQRKETCNGADQVNQVDETDANPPRKSATRTAASPAGCPPSDNAKAAAKTSDIVQDSDNESEEASLDVPIKHAQAATHLVAITIPDEDIPPQQDESQDGISSFHSSRQTPKRTYSKKRKSVFAPSREASTASTIPDSDQKSEIIDGVPEKQVESNEGITEDEDDVGSRVFKVARRDESTLDEIAAPTSTMGKLQTPSRPSAQTSATQQRCSTQRASKTPAATPVAPTPNSSASSSRTPSKFLLSGSKLSNGEKSWLRKQGTLVEDVPGRRANFICIVRHKDLPTTTKVLRSLIANKPVVSDQWVTDSKGAAELLNPFDYLHAGLRGSDIKQNERRYLWKGKTLFFTTAAAKSYGDDWADVQMIANEAGALEVVHGNATKGGELLHDKANTILFGVDVPKDRDAQALLSEYNRVVYDRKMFSTSVMRADVDLEDDEFKLVLSSKGADPSTRGRHR